VQNAPATDPLLTPADVDLTPAEAAQVLAARGPVHTLVINALNPDGSVRDQAAFDQLSTMTFDELDETTAREVDRMLACYGLEVTQ
jgi:hypothetical protein